jgi:hypothetical protein
MDLNLSDFLEVLSRASASTVMLLVIWAFMTERIVTRGRLDDCIRSRERVIAQRDELNKEIVTMKKRVKSP